MKKSKGKLLAQIGLFLIGALLAFSGILCFINPTGSLDTITNVIGWVLIVTGAATLIFVFTIGQILLFLGGVVGSAIMDILFGFLFLRFDGTMSRVFVILYAVILLGLGGLSLLLSLVTRIFRKEGGKLWLVALCAAVLFIALGIVAISNPLAGDTIFMIPVGLILLAVGAAYIGIGIAVGKTDKFLKNAEEAASVPGGNKPYFKDVTDEDDSSSNASPTA